MKAGTFLFRCPCDFCTVCMATQVDLIPIISSIQWANMASLLIFWQRLPSCISCQRLHGFQKAKPNLFARWDTITSICWKSCYVFKHWKDVGWPRMAPVVNKRMNCKGISTLTSTSIGLDQNISSNRIRYGSKTIQNIFSQITRRRLFASNYIQMVVSSLSSLIAGLTWPFPLCWLIPVRLEWLSQENGNNILTATLSEHDNSLDTKIEVEEVEYAICHLNHAGSDMISPEHLKFSDPVFRNWLCQIYNHQSTGKPLIEGCMVRLMSRLNICMHAGQAKFINEGDVYFCFYTAKTKLLF